MGFGRRGAEAGRGLNGAGKLAGGAAIAAMGSRVLGGTEADVQKVMELVKSDVTSKLDITSLVELNRGQLAQKIANLDAIEQLVVRLVRVAHETVVTGRLTVLLGTGRTA